MDESAAKMHSSRIHSDQEGLNFSAVKDLLQAHQRMLGIMINLNPKDCNQFRQLNHNIGVFSAEIERFHAQDKPMAQDSHNAIEIKNLVNEITTGCINLLSDINTQTQNSEDYPDLLVYQVDKMDLDEVEAPALSLREEYFSKVKQILLVERQELVKMSGKIIDEENFDNRIDVISELSDILRFEEEFGDGV